jgi:hypothetical protein
MPLPRYGVVIGTLIRFYRDPPDNFGHWYHGHIEVDTPSGLWTSALDVDTPTGLGMSLDWFKGCRLAITTWPPIRAQGRSITFARRS